MGVPSTSQINRFRDSNGPLIDLRSPGEFSQGHWPGAINIPLFSDEERSQVGTAYKKSGRNKAILLGLKFTGPKLRDLSNTLKTLKKEADTKNQQDSLQYLRIYCWRGGMRSGSVSWLAELLELKPLVLIGGYKTYRHWVLNQFEKEWPLRLLGGRTGTGKTELLLTLAQRGRSVIDLEGLANHRGSSFGALGQPNQPSTEHYENKLAEKLNHFQNISSKEIWLEAESSNLGRCRIPKAFFNQMKQAPVLEIIRSKTERIRHLVEIYSQHKQESLKEATLRISKRLGPQRTKEALEALEKEDWERACTAMLDYYDRCYEFELSKVSKRENIQLTGLSPIQAVEKLLGEGLIV